MKRLKLTNSSKVSLLDDEDFQYFNQWTWCLSDHGYIKRSEHISKENNNGKYGCKAIYLHREITKAPKGMSIDHLDSNPLNNQKSNLRVCSQAVNNKNTSSRKNSTSKYLGVHFDKTNKNWLAQVKINGKIISVGSFTTELEAALARDKTAKLDPDLKLNFPEGM